jgi:hypothetical protein
MVRPNFTDIARSGTDLIVNGASDPDAVDDIVEIRVVLTQGDKIAAPVTVASIFASWKVDVPADGFEDGTAVAFGIETHREHATTITWSQALDIPNA